MSTVKEKIQRIEKEITSTSALKKFLANKGSSWNILIRDLDQKISRLVHTYTDLSIKSLSHKCGVEFVFRGNGGKVPANGPYILVVHKRESRVPEVHLFEEQDKPRIGTIEIKDEVGVWVAKKVEEEEPKDEVEDESDSRHIILSQEAKKMIVDNKSVVEGLNTYATENKVTLQLLGEGVALPEEGVIAIMDTRDPDIKLMVFEEDARPKTGLLQKGVVVWAVIPDDPGVDPTWVNLLRNTSGDPVTDEQERKCRDSAAKLAGIFGDGDIDTALKENLGDPDKVVEEKPTTPCDPVDFTDVRRFQRAVHEWASATFPEQPLKSKIKHLAREVQELLEDPNDPLETADCLILLASIASLQGIDLLHCGWAKLFVNKDRKWSAPDADGICRHES